MKKRYPLFTCFDVLTLTVKKESQYFIQIAAARQKIFYAHDFLNVGEVTQKINPRPPKPSIINWQHFDFREHFFNRRFIFALTFRRF